MFVGGIEPALVAYKAGYAVLLRLIGLADGAEPVAECSGRNSCLVREMYQYVFVLGQRTCTQCQIPVQQPEGSKSLLAVQRIEGVFLRTAIYKVQYQWFGIVLQGVEQLLEKTFAQEFLALPSLGIVALDDGDNYIFAF